VDVSHRFDLETAVSPVEGGLESGKSLFSGHISGQYNIADNPNGGYLVAVVTAAMREVSQHPDPISVNTHFLRPGTPDADASIEVELVRSGRSVTTLRATLSQGGKERLVVLGTFGDLSKSTSSESVFTIDPPDLLPISECLLRSGVEQGLNLPILERVDVQLPPPFAMAGHSDKALVEGWIRFADGRRPDTHAMTLFSDAFPPPVFTALGNIGWVPTIELTVHIRRKPQPGWMKGRFFTTDLTDGRFVEDGLLWDSSGALVAQSRQLAMLLTPPPG
jgi:acyl-CoA thioesterase